LSINFSYDGKGIGTFQGDAIRNITGATYAWRNENMGTGYGCLKATLLSALRVVMAGGDGNDFGLIEFDASLDSKVTTANENRPASISALVCISY